MQDYKHKNESLTGAVASDLILKLFDGRTEVPRRVIYEKVIEFHLSHGGLRPPSENSDPVLNGLDRLRGEGKADNPKRGFWNINSAGVKSDILIDRGTCTFCGWADPPEMFKYHTPGDAPVCTTCAEKGILMLPDSEVTYEQGEGNYQSGTLRLKDSAGQILFPNKKWEEKGLHRNDR